MLRKLWNRFGRRAASTTSRSRADYRTHLSLEPLEQRTLLSMFAIFNTTIDSGQMKLDRNGESRLFILGDESGDSMTIGVDGNNNVTVGGSDQIYTGWNESTHMPDDLGTVAASSVKAIAADLGGGNDTLDLSAVTSAKFTGLVDGNIIISGGAGDDIITGSGFGDVISGDGGADVIHGGDGDDVIHGGDGDDTIYGDAGDDILSGGDGDDTLSSGFGAVSFLGNGFKDGVDQGDLAGSGLNEASGMIIGRKTTSKARIWTIEDRNNPVRLWVNDLNGVSRGYHPFDTATVKVTNVDWEGLAFYEDGNGKKWIYIGDIGNNDGDDVTHTIYRTEEPTTTDTQTGAQSTIANSAVERIVFDYPSGKDHDAETLMVDPITGDIYIVSKREYNSTDNGSLYKIAAGDANWTVVTSAAPAKVTASGLGEISTNTLAPTGQNSRFAFSGGDISTDGKNVLLRTDRTIYQFHRDSTTGPGNSIGDLLTGTSYQPVQVIAAYERGNRESVAFNDAGDKIYTVSEHDPNDSSLNNPNRWGQGDLAQEVLMYGAGQGTDTFVYSADLTQNGYVDFEDLTILLANWNQNATQAEGNLVEPDTTPVNFADLTVLLAAWTGPPPAPSPAPPAATVADGDTVYTTSMDIDFTFDFEVQGVDASDLELTGIGGIDATVDTPTNPTGNTWRFHVSGLKIGPVEALLGPDAGDIQDMSNDNVEPLAIDFIAMPGVTMTSGALDVDGSSTADTIIVAADGSGKLTLSGATVDLGSGDIAASAVTSIVVDGLAGNDTLDLSGVTGSDFTGAGLSGNITMYGGSGDDTLIGSAFDDTIDGGTGDDTLSGGDGDDALDGQGGDDLYYGGAGTDTIAESPSGTVNLTLTQLSGTQVDITWADAVDEDGYKVWKYGSPTVLIATVGHDATSYTVTGLGAGTHNFSVETYNEAGSFWSDGSTWKPITMVMPTDPTSLTPIAVSGSQVDLTWNDADLEDGYYVYQYGTEDPIATLNPGATSHAVTGLSRGVTYNFSVSAFNTVGENFNASPSGWQAIKIEPTAPENLALTVVSSTQIDLTWDDADLEEGYKIYQYATPTSILLDTLSPDATSFSVTGLSPSTTYFFSISAYDSVVEKFNTNPSGWQSATTALLLGEAARLEQVDDPATVSEEQLAPLVEEAIRRWAETGIDPRVVARLEQTEVRVEALAPDYLGLAYSDSGVIVLDDDASGRGWYIDSTPEDDVEFSEVSPHGEMVALADGPAADAVDLLTAVMHEMGHLLGFGHEGGHYTMSETLEAEVRRLPHTHDAEPIYDLDSAGGLGGFVHRLSEPVPARDGSGRSVVAWRLESEDELLWAIYRPDVGQRLGPAAALDAVMADWGLAN